MPLSPRGAIPITGGLESPLIGVWQLVDVLCQFSNLSGGFHQLPNIRMQARVAPHTPLSTAHTYAAVLIADLQGPWVLGQKGCPPSSGLQPGAVSSHIGQQHGSVFLGTA